MAVKHRAQDAQTPSILRALVGHREPEPEHEPRHREHRFHGDQREALELADEEPPRET